MHLLSKLLVRISLLFCCADIVAQEKIHIVLGDNYGKHAMVVEGRPAGIQKDLLDWFLIEHMKLEVVIEAMPWKRAQKLVELKRADGYFTAYTKQRVEVLKLIPSSKPFYTTRVKMHTWKGNPISAELGKLDTIEGLLEMNELRHIFIRGHGYHEEQFKAAKIIERVDSAQQIPKFLLQYKRADIFVEQSELFYPVAEEAGLVHQIETLDNIHFKSLFWHLYIRPESQHVSLMREVDLALDQAISSGILYAKVRDIFEKYGLSYSE